MYPRQSSLPRPLSPFLPSTPRMETEGPAPSDGEVGEHPDRLPSENRIGRRTDMEKTKNVRKRGLTPFPPWSILERWLGSSPIWEPGIGIGT